MLHDKGRKDILKKVLKKNIRMGVFMKKIILASASPRRRELLDRIGVEFEVIASGAEETITDTCPARVVEELSCCKARDVFERTQGDVLVLGADTVVALGGSIFGKPADRDDAVKMLKSLQGNVHQVYTGVTVLVRDGEKVQEKSFHEKTEVTFYPMTEEEIQSYVDTGEPMDKAGAYGIQGEAVVFVKKIDGDYNNVVGFPLARVYQELKAMGIDIRERQR